MSQSKSAAGAVKLTFSGYQRFVVGVLAFLQFTIVLDFMLLAPLGALVIPQLRITTAQFGLIVSAYALSAGVSGLLTAGFADRFDRKKLLLFFYSGFLVGTLLCGLASTYYWLLFARMVTGIFAGVVGSAAFAIVTDLFPMQMRGRVMGVLQTAFAASSVLGIPFGLMLSNRWGWNAPFFMTVVVSAVVGAVIWARLRPIDEHLKHHPDRSPVHHLLHTISNRSYVVGFLATGTLSVGGFMLMPFTSVFVVNNVGLPISKLPLVYMITGAISIVTGPLIGRASDAFGYLKVFGFGCAVTIVMVVIYTHLGTVGLGTLVIVMVLLQIGIFSRMISSSALTSALPAPGDRGSYMSISSSLQQAAGGVAAMLAGLIVVQTPTGMLEHFDILGYVLICTTLVSLTLMYFIDKAVGRSRAARAAAAPEASVSSP
ncbi:MAG TPA: MFS transporter [Steroidobacteraceae bacterium]|nr:MFS transporter [Steroidobacteraceae bacterium]